MARFIRIFLFVFFSLSAVISSHPFSHAAFAGKRVKIVGLTDLHGALQSTVTKNKSGASVKSGGAALVTSYVKILREEDKAVPTFLVDSGDLFQGTLVSNLKEGQPVVRYYNALRLDAAALGNHEFDYGPVGPNSVPKNPGEDPVGALKMRIREAQFPFLAANVFEKNSHRIPQWLKSSVLLERGGVKLGIVGFATPSTPSTTMSKNVMSLDFAEPAQWIATEAKRLKAKGADFLILISHEGALCGDNRIEQVNNLSTCRDGGLFEVLKQIPSGTFDVVFGGHTHGGVTKQVNGMLVLQAYSSGRDIIWATLEQNSLGKNRVVQFTPPVEICEQVVAYKGRPTCSPSLVTETEGRAIPNRFLGQPVREDAATLRLLAKDFRDAEKVERQPIGITLKTDFQKSYYEENPLGNFVSDTLYSGFSKYIDAVLVNNGGLRGPGIRAGRILYGHVYSILPFDNRMALVKLTGKQLHQALEIGISKKHGGYSWSQVTFDAAVAAA